MSLHLHFIFIPHILFISYCFSFTVFLLISHNFSLVSYCTNLLQTLHKTVLEGVYLWAGPEWLILHESRAQTVLLSNVILFSVTIFRTKLNTLSQLALLWGMHSKAFRSFGSAPSLSKRPSSVTHHLTSHTKLATTATYSTCSRLLQVAVIARLVTELRFFLLRSGPGYYFLITQVKIREIYGKILIREDGGKEG